MQAKQVEVDDTSRALTDLYKNEAAVADGLHNTIPASLQEKHHQNCVQRKKMKDRLTMDKLVSKLQERLSEKSKKDLLREDCGNFSDEMLV